MSGLFSLWMGNVLKDGKMRPEAESPAERRLQVGHSEAQKQRPRRRAQRFVRAAPSMAGTIADGKPTCAVGRRDATYRRSLAASDVVAAACSVVLALTIFGDDALQPATLVALPLVVLVAKFTGLYDRDELV